MYMQSRRERKRVSEIHGSEALSVSLLQFCERGLKSCSFHCITFGGERERVNRPFFWAFGVLCICKASKSPHNCVLSSPFSLPFFPIFCVVCKSL